MADRDDIAVDFMDMTNDRRVWVRPADLRDGFALGNLYRDFLRVEAVKVRGVRNSLPKSSADNHA